MVAILPKKWLLLSVMGSTLKEFAMNFYQGCYQHSSLSVSMGCLSFFTITQVQPIFLGGGIIPLGVGLKVTAVLCRLCAL